MFTSSTMVQNIDPILLPVGLTMTSNEENIVFPNSRECVNKQRYSGSQQCTNRKFVKPSIRTPVTSKCLETSSTNNCLMVNKDAGAPESGTFIKPNLPLDRSSVSAQKANNTRTLSLGIEYISFNPGNENSKLVFNCKVCGKIVGNIFDIDFHNIDQGHFKCTFKDCNKIKFPSQFELTAHLEAKHKTVPLTNHSTSRAAVFSHLALASQSPKQSATVLPQNQSSPVPRSRYSNSKHVDKGVGSRTDQTNSTCEEIVLLDDSEEMDCNVEEQTSSGSVNVNSLATSVIKSTDSRHISHLNKPSNNMCPPTPNNTLNSLLRQGRGSRNLEATQHSQNNVSVQPEFREELSNITSTPRKIINRIADRPPRLPTVDLTREMPLQSPRAIPNKIQTSPRRKSGQTSTSGNSFTCKICGKNLATQNFLNLHMKTAHRSPNKPFRCSKCTTNYSTHEALIEHLKVFHNIIPDSRTMCIPVVDLNKPGSQEHLMQLGIEHFIPLSDLAADSNGNYCIPLYILRGNGEGTRTDTFRTKEVLKLGPLKTLPF